jgi:hypothetical protein
LLSRSLPPLIASLIGDDWTSMATLPFFRADKACLVGRTVCAREFVERVVSVVRSGNEAAPEGWPVGIISDELDVSELAVVQKGVAAAMKAMGYPRTSNGKGGNYVNLRSTIAIVKKRRRRNAGNAPPPPVQKEDVAAADREESADLPDPAADDGVGCRVDAHVQAPSSGGAGAIGAHVDGVQAPDSAVGTGGADDVPVPADDAVEDDDDDAFEGHAVPTGVELMTVPVAPWPRISFDVSPHAITRGVMTHVMSFAWDVPHGR